MNVLKWKASPLPSRSGTRVTQRGGDYRSDPTGPVKLDMQNHSYRQNEWGEAVLNVSCDSMCHSMTELRPDQLNKLRPEEGSVLLTKSCF